MSEVTLEDDQPHAVDAMLHYLYTFHLPQGSVSLKTALNLFVLGDKYCVPSLQVTAKRYLYSNISDWCIGNAEPEKVEEMKGILKWANGIEDCSDFWEEDQEAAGKFCAFIGCLYGTGSGHPELSDLKKIATKEVVMYHAYILLRARSAFAGLLHEHSTFSFDLMMAFGEQAARYEETILEMANEIGELKP